VPEEVKRERYARVMEAQQRIAREIQAAKVGRTPHVLVDDVGACRARWSGRSAADAPDVDGRVLLDTDGTVVIGDLVEALVVGADDYDLARALRTLPWRPNVPMWGAVGHAH
jgi:ribosomal protein S12 methylthiotransferase